MRDLTEEEELLHVYDNVFAAEEYTAEAMLDAAVNTLYGELQQRGEAMLAVNKQIIGKHGDLHTIDFDTYTCETDIREKTKAQRESFNEHYAEIGEHHEALSETYQDWWISALKLRDVEQLTADMLREALDGDIDDPTDGEDVHIAFFFDPQTLQYTVQTAKGDGFVQQQASGVLHEDVAIRVMIGSEAEVEQHVEDLFDEYTLKKNEALGQVQRSTGKHGADNGDPDDMLMYG